MTVVYSVIFLTGTTGRVKILIKNKIIFIIHDKVGHKFTGNNK
jgi:hypothetical protein